MIILIIHLSKMNIILLHFSLINTNMLEAYMKEMEEYPSDQYELVFCDLLVMYGSVLDLLRSCVIYDTPIRQELLSNHNFLLATLSLLTITYSGTITLLQVSINLKTGSVKMYAV